MLAKLIFLFVTIPLVDLILLLVLSSYIGWVWSVTIVILSGIVGALLAKLSYRYVLYRFASNARKLQFSGDLLTDGFLIFFAAGMLLTPGFLTDLMGFSLLIPACRTWYKKHLTRWFQRNFKLDSFTYHSSSCEVGTGTVDGEVQQSEEAPFSRTLFPQQQVFPEGPPNGENSNPDKKDSFRR